MRFYKKTLCCLLLMMCLLSGCKQRTLTKYSTVYFDYFDTVSTIVGYDESEEKFKEVAEYIRSELERYDNLYDAYDALTGLNNMNYLNKHAAEEPVEVDDDLFDLLKMGEEVYTLTNGMTDFAMGSVFLIWHDHRTEASFDPSLASVPSLEELQSAAKHADINDVILDEDNHTVYYRDAQLRLDVGAIAKGYAIEQIAQSLMEKGITHYSLNIGGNVRTIGSKADNSPWLVAIQDPDLQSGQEYVEVVELKDKALTTSGSYQRYYVVDNVRYHHIISPITLFPENTYLSVSIINEDAGLGDALSTALFNMSLEDGMALINSLEHTEAMWILADKTMVYSDGFEAFIRP